MGLLPLIPRTPDASCCAPASGSGRAGSSGLDEDAAVRLAASFRALGDPIRLRLLSMIAASDEVCVCDLTPAFDVSGPTISHHLKVLREAGLVTSERRGTWVYYRTSPDPAGALVTALDTLGLAADA